MRFDEEHTDKAFVDSILQFFYFVTEVSTSQTLTISYVLDFFILMRVRKMCFRSAVGMVWTMQNYKKSGNPNQVKKDE